MSGVRTRRSPVRSCACPYGRAITRRPGHGTRMHAVGSPCGAGRESRGPLWACRGRDQWGGVRRDGRGGDRSGLPGRAGGVMTAVAMQNFAEPFIRLRADRRLRRGRIVLLAGGTGQPYVTRDCFQPPTALGSPAWRTSSGAGGSLGRVWQGVREVKLMPSARRPGMPMRAGFAVHWRAASWTLCGDWGLRCGSSARWLIARFARRGGGAQHGD